MIAGMLMFISFSAIAGERLEQMKFTLITRKIIFGILMGLVLAFSVQGFQQEHPVEIQVPRAVSGLPNGLETLTIIAPENAFVRIGSPEDTFPLENSSNPTQSRTIYRSTLTLPRETGTYALSVFIEETRYRVAVSVTADPVQTGDLTVRVDPFKGATGTTATVTVTATDSQNRPANVTVILTATGGTLSTSSVETGTDGTQTVLLTRGSTAGNENYVVGSAANYDVVSSRFLISEAPPITPPTAGDPTELEVYDGNNQRGTLNMPLEEPFVVKVMDAYEAPVKDARVRFRVTQGGGQFSPRIPRTDTKGLAETIFTPTSAGRIRIVTTVAGIEDTATFTVQAVRSDADSSNDQRQPPSADPVPVSTPITPYDVNKDGTVDNMDARLVIEALGTSNATYDINGDGTVDFLDVVLVFDNRDEGAASAPTVLGMQLSAVQIDRIQAQIDLLIATGDRSPAAMRTLIYLQHLIATARPEQTRLLANYPNPFNPETWIPYELARDTDVRITIYNTQGVVIRTLALGHQSAGYYTGRDRAAYWDGRNALGEQVASGVYFYQFETDTMSSMRKMVILK